VLEGDGRLHHIFALHIELAQYLPIPIADRCDYLQGGLGGSFAASEHLATDTDSFFLIPFGTQGPPQFLGINGCHQIPQRSIDLRTDKLDHH
jgi:hypothetical protein